MGLIMYTNRYCFGGVFQCYCIAWVEYVGLILHKQLCIVLYWWNMMRLILYTQLLHCIGGVCGANNGLISTQCRGATPQAALPTPAWDTTSNTSNPKEGIYTTKHFGTTHQTTQQKAPNPMKPHSAWSRAAELI